MFTFGNSGWENNIVNHQFVLMTMIVSLEWYAVYTQLIKTSAVLERFTYCVGFYSSNYSNVKWCAHTNTSGIFMMHFTCSFSKYVALTWGAPGGTQLIWGHNNLGARVFFLPASFLFSVWSFFPSEWSNSYIFNAHFSSRFSVCNANLMLCFTLPECRSSYNIL